MSPQQPGHITALYPCHCCTLAWQRSSVLDVHIIINCLELVKSWQYISSPLCCPSQPHTFIAVSVTWPMIKCTLIYVVSLCLGNVSILTLVHSHLHSSLHLSPLSSELWLSGWAGKHLHFCYKMQWYSDFSAVGMAEKYILYNTLLLSTVSLAPTHIGWTICKTGNC